MEAWKIYNLQLKFFIADCFLFLLMFLESIAECAMCQKIVMDIEKLSADKSKNLEEMMSEVCKVLPENHKLKVCKRLY